MIKKWIFQINCGLGGCALLALGGATLFFFLGSEELVIADTLPPPRTLPSGSFVMPKQACESIGTGCFDLKFTPITSQLPDLRNQLTYQGRNGRLDANTDRTVMHFIFNGNPSPTPLIAKEKRYILYDRSQTPPQYRFSPDNVETALWIEPTIDGNDAIVDVRMKGENGTIAKEPANYAQLRLHERDNASNRTGKNWELGKWRVDGSLLARQKATWRGQDLFLQRHGGPEYDALKEKHRIDFLDEESPYSIYVAANDILIWENDQWKNAAPGANTLNHPLLVIKKIDERLMNLELWDVGGKNKVILNLVKMTEAWAPEMLEQSFKCLGARTRSQYIFDIDELRMLLSPKDWLLQTEEGWVKIIEPDEIDQYVERKKTGVLFIFDGVEKKEGKQVLKGVMFNPSRTELKDVEILIKQKGSAAIAKANQKDEELSDEDEVDDDEDDDDEDDDVEMDDDYPSNSKIKVNKSGSKPHTLP